MPINNHAFREQEIWFSCLMSAALSVRRLHRVRTVARIGTMTGR